MLLRENISDWSSLRCNPVHSGRLNLANAKNGSFGRHLRTCHSREFSSHLRHGPLVFYWKCEEVVTFFFVLNVSIDCIAVHKVLNIIISFLGNVKMDMLTEMPIPLTVSIYKSVRQERKAGENVQHSQVIHCYFVIFTGILHILLLCR